MDDLLLPIAVHFLIKFLGAFGIDAVGAAPGLVCRVEVTPGDLSSLLTDTAVLEEQGHPVIPLLIALYSIPHTLGFHQPDLLIFLVSLQQPQEDCSPGLLLQKLFLQLYIPLILTEVPFKLDHLHTVRGEQALVVHRGEGVAGQPHLKLRREVEGFPVQLPGRDRVPAGVVLDDGLIQLPGIIRLAHGQKTGAFQSADHGVRLRIGPAATALADEVHSDGLGVVTQDRVDGVQQRTLSVAGGLTVGDEHTLLIRHTDQGIPQRPLEVCRHIPVSAGDLINEAIPAREVRVHGFHWEVTGCFHGQIIFCPVEMELPGFQIIGAILAVDDVWIRVEPGDAYPCLSLGVLQNTVSDTAVAQLRDKLPILLLILLRYLAAIELHQAGKLLKVFAGKDAARVLDPYAAVIAVPLLGFWAVDGIVCIALGEQLRHCHLIPLIRGIVMRMLRHDRREHLGLLLIHEVLSILQLKEGGLLHAFLIDHGHFLAFFTARANTSTAQLWESSSHHAHLLEMQGRAVSSEGFRGQNFFSSMLLRHLPVQSHNVLDNVVTEDTADKSVHLRGVNGTLKQILSSNPHKVDQKEHADVGDRQTYDEQGDVNFLVLIHGATPPLSDSSEYGFPCGISGFPASQWIEAHPV